MRSKTEIFSIFGQIESIVAQDMIDKGRVNKIAADMIPPTVRFNELGQPALFAIVIPKQLLAEFNNRVANLRA